MTQSGSLLLEEASAPDIVEVTDRTAFMVVEEEWNALVESTADEPFYRHEYIRLWIDNFVPDAKLRILTGRDHGGRLVAALPLVAERAFLYGVPVRQLVSPTNVHSFRFDLIAEHRESAARAFFEALAADDTWNVIKITDVPDGGNAWDLYAMALEAGFPSGAWESQRSPYVPLPSTYDAIETGLTSKFKANLRRRRRRLEERGAISVDRVAGGAQLHNRLENCLALERGGWKGRNGTAAAQSAQVHGFYTGLAQRAASDGNLSLYFLMLDGEAIAAQYGLTRHGVYSLLMTCYDEAFREFGPSALDRGACSAVRRDVARGDPEKRGLAAAVRPHERDPIPSPHDEPNFRTRRLDGSAGDAFGAGCVPITPLEGLPRRARRLALVELFGKVPSNPRAVRDYEVARGL